MKTWLCPEASGTSKHFKLNLDSTDNSAKGYGDRQGGYASYPCGAKQLAVEKKDTLKAGQKNIRHQGHTDIQHITFLPTHLKPIYWAPGFLIDPTKLKLTPRSGNRSCQKS